MAQETAGRSDDDRGRAAAAAAAAERVRPDTTIGLGSGRAVRAVVAALARRWPDGARLRAVVASRSTDAAAREAGIEVVDLTAAARLDRVIDGADEVDPTLALLKGGGGALLHEKVLADAGGGLLVVAEARKRVPRLGVRNPLPVEVVRFGWEVTARRIAELLGPVRLRADADGEPFVTEEGHLLLDAPLGPGADLRALDLALAAVPGVVEHGLFLGIARTVVLGHTDGRVEELTAEVSRS